MEQLLKYFEVSTLAINKDAELMIREQIDYLINNNFEKLIHILYRVDVSEKKIKEAISLRKENASKIIYDLLKERETEKELSRRKHSGQNRKPGDGEW